ncbi:glycosyltransferase family 4 protein [Alkalibacter mobilis]|uniref:glycosyltransferase family 4 protein n=1 Tax=Alkalibacter mobilis TaxID=2787712 RepID=UPI0018A0180B|nr:MraY family glycosyltransferase [Alkalibacter mobilis]MBF7096139.1 undecaprenyl/decaprenyl-phosphate alpha-N-acetylglucosaminyl 1-phosphate transferase [Alkalibacter mobilis]
MNPLLIYITCLAIAIGLTPLVSKVAIAVGAVDKPNKRKVHKVLMPTLGGLAIFGAFYAGHLLFRYPHYQFNAIFIGSLIILVTGIIDDIFDLSPKIKLLAQFTAASVVIFYGQLYFRSFTFPFIGVVDPGYLGCVVAYLWIIGMTNAINLIDGLDGLASGVSSITFLTMYYLAAQMNDYFIMTYALILAGSTMGFLIYNFHPAKIFMGDTGAMFLGYIISVMALMGFRNATFISFVVPVLILGVPVFDTLFAIIRRKLSGKSVIEADKGHLHHVLMAQNASQTKSVLIIYGISILFSLVAIVYNTISAQMGVVLVVCVYLMIRILSRKMFKNKEEPNE